MHDHAKDARGHWDALYTGKASDHEPADADLLAVAAELTPGAVLDVGCGAGGLCVALVQRGWSATGIDVTPKAIAAAERVAAAEGVEARFVAIDATHWEPDRSYQLVTCNCGVPPRREDRRQVYATMRRALAPGGLVAIKVHLGNPTRHETWAGYASLDAAELERGFAGFEVLRADTMDAAPHAHAGPAHAHERWTALLFVARKPAG